MDYRTAWIVVVIGMAGLLLLLLALYFQNRQLKKSMAERAQIEKDLEDKEQRYRSIVSVSNTGAWEYHHRTGYLWCSPEYYSMLGYDSSDFRAENEDNIRESWLNLVHPEDRDRALRTFLEYLEKGSVGMYEQIFRMPHQNGSIVWIWSRGQTLKKSDGTLAELTVGTHIDITERKLAEEALRLSEEKYRLLFHNNPLPMLLYDLESLRFLDVNRAAVAKYGYNREEFLKMDITEIRPSEDLERLMDNVRESSGDFTHSGEWRHRTKCGKVFPVEIISHSITYRNRPARLALANDITIRKEYEEKLRQLNMELEEQVSERTAQLEASNRELEAFGYSVSHDLRAPLRHVSGYVDLLKSRYNDDLSEKARHYLDMVTRSSQQMGTLIEELLNFSRTGRKELRYAMVDMNTMVRDMIENLKEDMGDRSISWDVSDLPGVFGDAGLLKLVWINLLQNAVKYTGRVDQAVISVGFREEPDKMVYFVRDNGAGFDMKYVHKLFGVFQRLHNQSEFEGTGIGLANVQRIVRKHGGEAWAEGQPDHGATFYFSIPVNSEETHGQT
ncbi:PAS domain S-box protein [Balneolales bacterium ANBcel1]|nr:PAS domain S-box protein [Balneolales bacterium ANBcel1]